MRKILFYLLFTQLIWAQISLKSPHLREPEKAIGYVDSCATFWLQTWDESRGGFYTNIDKYGDVITNWGTNKNMLTQTRNAYGLIRAYMLTGNENYLEYAESALSFLYEHAWDDTYGGWYGDLDENGNPNSRFGNKTAFNQHYALLGIMAAFEVTGDTSHFAWLEKGYQHLEDCFWDSRIGYEGYFDETNFNGTNRFNKSFNATVDAVTTHLLYLYLLTQEEKYLLRLEEIADQMINRLVASMDYQAVGFAEKYTADWQINASETMTIMGHILKTAWCLGRIYQVNANDNYLPAAEQLVADVLTNGYDHRFGGPYKDYNRVTGEMLMWGNPDTAKAWWQMEQAVVAGLQLFNITNDSTYLEMADGTLDFFMKYFVDHEYGEVYENRTNYGAETWGENKGGGGKAGYHSIELGYYTYLYGNLLIHKKPATLHYKFAPADFPRDIRLFPMAIDPAQLQLNSVKFNETAYTSFNATECILHLNAGVGGHFIVTFAPAGRTAIALSDIRTEPKRFTLYSNYPNPFNSTTMIHYYLPDPTPVTINIFNMNGKMIRQLVDRQENSGYKTLQWNGRDDTGHPVSSGNYFYQIITPGQKLTGKCLFIK
ncbi:MAG: AGE family epimerase/isomerase [Candidatus Marinimicrobia bacterium]|nr:AGE family epimerase/isomerase [Candidatus Neomarinimicrobiota bacterium]